MADFEPVLSRNWNVPDSNMLRVYESRGGYQSARKALTAMDPDQVVALIKDSELRGRGGAGFSCGLKWSFLPKNREETLMCVNGDESEPATFNNRLLIEKDPHQFIEGILISCFATKASTAYVYLRFEYINAYRIMEVAITEAKAAEHLGQNIYGSGFNLAIWLHRGAGAYICGEETVLIESLERRRGWPRIKPPFPAVEGAFRKPTVVNNIETLCCVPHIIERGAGWIKSIGVPKSYGPKPYCISGHVNKQTCVERPLGVTCRELIHAHGGGVWKGRKAKAAVPGGISMGLLSAEELDTPLDFESLRKPGCLGLGTAAVTVIDDHTSIVDVLYNTCRFFAHESCGQCTPLPRGDGVDLHDHAAEQGRGRSGRGPGRHAPDGEHHGDHTGHHDLRPGRRRRLAGQERDQEVPRRVRGLFPHPPEPGRGGHTGPGGDRAWLLAEPLKHQYARSHDAPGGPQHLGRAAGRLHRAGRSFNAGWLHRRSFRGVVPGERPAGLDALEDRPAPVGLCAVPTWPEATT